MNKDIIGGGCQDRDIAFKRKYNFRMQELCDSLFFVTMKMEIFSNYMSFT